MTINVSATFNPDGWITSIIVEGLSTQDLPGAVQALTSKARRPQPHLDAAETKVMSIPNYGHSR
jgi:uncharacterized protein YidB (DUF937 family)